METPLISVIVPAYNAEKWIEDCCRSVFSQTYPNWELIVVDDGSSDETLQCAGAVSRGMDNVRLIHTENHGVCHARNTGLEAAQGEYIAFLDADDMLVPNCLEFLYQRLTEDRCDIAIGQKISVRRNGSLVEQHYPKPHELWQGTQALEQSLRDHPATYSVWGKLFRKQLLDSVRFAEGMRVHEDSFFLFQCLMKQPRVTVSDTVVIRYRITENSASRTLFSDKFFDILCLAEKKRELILQYYPQFQNLAENVTVKANMSLLRLLCQTWDRQYCMAEKNCLQLIRSRSTYFVPATAWDRKWFRILMRRLYIPYKIGFTMKNYVKGICKRVFAHE